MLDVGKASANLPQYKIGSANVLAREETLWISLWMIQVENTNRVSISTTRSVTVKGGSTAR
jgi:hypothetical protein